MLFQFWTFLIELLMRETFKLYNIIVLGILIIFLGFFTNYSFGAIQIAIDESEWIFFSLVLLSFVIVTTITIILGYPFYKNLK